MRPASDVADDIVSAANIVTCAGYYECDPIAVTAIIEADRKQVREEVVREVCEWLKNQDRFGEWGEAAYEIKREFLGEKA